jgi:hypothetical protein
MNRVITEAVEKEVSQRWAEFEEKHPRLAQEMQFDWHVGEASEMIRADERYQTAIRRGLAGEQLLAALGDLIRRAVDVVMKR